MTFSCQDDRCPWSLELESMKTKIILTAWQHDQDNCLNGRSNFCLALFSLNWHFLSQDDHCPWSLELESKRTKIILTVWQYDQDNCLNGRSNFCQAIFSLNWHFLSHDDACPWSLVLVLVKMIPVHEVRGLSLGGQRSYWQHGNMISTTVSMVRATFAKHFLL